MDAVKSEANHIQGMPGASMNGVKPEIIGIEEVKAKRLSRLPMWMFNSQMMLTWRVKIKILKDEKLEIKNCKLDI